MADLEIDKTERRHEDAGERGVDNRAADDERDVDHMMMDDRVGDGDRYEQVQTQQETDEPVRDRNRRRDVEQEGDHKAGQPDPESHDHPFDPLPVETAHVEICDQQRDEADGEYERTYDDE